METLLANILDQNGNSNYGFSLSLAADHRDFLLSARPLRQRVPG
jgi:hypothetical protein